MGTLRDLAARLRAAAEPRHEAEPAPDGTNTEPADLADEAAAMLAALEAEACGAYPVLPAAEHQAALAGLMRAAAVRAPIPPPRPP